MISLLRKLRHGPLSFLSPVWVVLGRLYRFVFQHLGHNFSVKHKIGRYGPFKMDVEFTFSDFENWGGHHNNGFESCVEAAKNAKCFFDVGGHIGLVTMPVASVIAKKGIVHTFEPAAANLKHLKSHIKKNHFNNIILVESLVGSEDKKDIVFYEQPKSTGQNALAIKKDHEKYVETKHTQVSLDSYCDKNNILPDVIKIDVEGAEWHVLNGARDIFLKKDILVFLSLHPVELELLGKDVKSVIELIGELGYCITEIDGTEVKRFKLSEYLMKPCSSLKETNNAK